MLTLDGAVDAKKDLEITAAEAKQFAECFKDPAKTKKSPPTVAGQKYFITMADGQDCNGKRGTGEGLYSRKSNRYILLIVHTNKTQPGTAAGILTRYVDHLMEAGK